MARFCPAHNAQDARKLFNDDLRDATSYAVMVNDEMAGMLSLYTTIGKNDAPDHLSLEVAYIMLPNQQGRGYMTRALKQLIRYLRRHSVIKRLVALVSRRNYASRKVLVRNHFDNYNSVLDMNSGNEDLVYQLNLSNE